MRVTELVRNAIVRYGVRWDMSRNHVVRYRRAPPDQQQLRVPSDQQQQPVLWIRPFEQFIQNKTYASGGDLEFVNTHLDTFLADVAMMSEPELRATIDVNYVSITNPNLVIVIDDDGTTYQRSKITIMQWLCLLVWSTNADVTTEVNVHLVVRHNVQEKGEVLLKLLNRAFERLNANKIRFSLAVVFTIDDMCRWIQEWLQTIVTYPFVQVSVTLKHNTLLPCAATWLVDNGFVIPIPIPSAAVVVATRVRTHTGA